MPEFTSDWFTAHIPLWESMLAPLMDQPVHCLEIGSHEGRSALWTLERVCANQDSTLTCIDPWRYAESEARFDRNTAMSGLGAKLRKIKGHSWVELRALQLGRYSFAYIDGSHEALHVLEDACLVFRLLRPGGVICFDDYQWVATTRYQPPKPAIDAWLAIYAHRIDVLHVGYQVFARMRP